MSTNRTVKGLLGKKLGMTQAWDENNRLVPITVVEAGSNVITQIKTLENDGYTAIQVAYGAIDPRKVNQPEAGHFAKAEVNPRRYIAEIRTNDADSYAVGQELG
jgi:large subunit ribosomal protein L3